MTISDETTVLDAQVGNTMVDNNLSDSNVVSFPPLDFFLTDDLGQHLASKKFASSAKASVTVEILRSGTYNGSTCALILLKVSFLYTKDSRLRGATLKVTVSAPSGSKQVPSFARIAPEFARGPETVVQHSQSRQSGLGLATATVFPVSFNASGGVTHTTTYSTSTFVHIASMITDSSDELIQDLAEFIFVEDSTNQSGIPNTLVAGLIVLLDKSVAGDDTRQGFTEAVESFPGHHRT